MMKYVTPEVRPVAVPVRVPETLTVCPTYNPEVDVHDSCPAVPVTATAFNIGEATEVEETVAPDGIPVPDIDCPAPIKMLFVDKYIVVVLFKYADAVNTPIGLRLVPVIRPPSTGVLTLLSISDKF
jgi:hypothetical protein